MEPLIAPNHRLGFPTTTTLAAETVTTTIAEAPIRKLESSAHKVPLGLFFAADNNNNWPTMVELTTRR